MTKKRTSKKVQDDKPFNMFAWSMKIPLSDDLWLGMQLRNIAMVDQLFIRPVEQDALSAYYERDRTPIDILMPLSALSQMWIFALYEVLRTWRQRAEELTSLADRYKSLNKSARQSFLDECIDKAKEKEKFVRIAPTFQSQYVARIGEKKFVGEIKQYREKTELMFRRAEGLRVTLAKHEVPRTNRYAAEAPGYGRMNMMTGSMYWQFALKDGSIDVVDRREMANEFLAIEE